FAPHVENIGADTVAVAEHLSRQHLVATDDGFAAAQIDNDAAIFDALDNAVDDIADAVLEFLVLAVALGLAHLLHDNLFGGLRGNAAVFERRQGVGNGVADLRSGIGAPGVFQGDLVGRILDLLDHEHVARQPQLALLGVDLGVNVGFAPVASARRFGDGGSSPRLLRSPRSAALPRRIDSAINSSVRTSLASAISSMTNRTSQSSPPRVSSRCSRSASPSTPASVPRNRLRPSCATAISIFTR